MMNEYSKKKIEDLLEAMDEWITVWHNGPNTGRSLHQYLQMSWQEYRVFAESPQTWAQNILDKKVKDHSRSET